MRVVQFIFRTARSLSKTVHLKATSPLAATAPTVKMAAAAVLALPVALARSVTPANTLRLSGPVAEDQKEVAQAAVTAGAEVPSSRVKAQVVAICVAAREARMDKMDVRGAEVEVEVTMHVVQAECSYVRELGVMEVTVAAAEGDPGAVVTAVLGAGVVHRLVV